MLLIYAVYFLIGAVGITQLPLLVDLVNILFPSLQLGRFTQKWMGVMLFGMLVTVALVGYAAFISFFLPLWIYPTNSIFSPEGMAHILFASWMWCNAMYNYVCAASFSAGMVPRKTGELKCEELPDSSVPQEFFVERPAGICRHCPGARPRGAFHCHICNGCIEGFDHHCPFVKNCIGVKNYTYFFFFLVYSTAGMIYSSMLTFPLFNECWLSRETCSEGLTASLAFVAAIGLFSASVGLLLAQCFLLLADVRTAQFLFYFRYSWSLRPLLQRIRDLHFLQSDSHVSSMLSGPRTQVWHWLIPGGEFLLQSSSKKTQ
eukprot:m.344856 g.344856  ORF g.344856 m.344856 type:complete len:317 (+) comp25339_c0_seq1:166-1116(+)